MRDCMGGEMVYMPFFQSPGKHIRIVLLCLKSKGFYPIIEYIMNVKPVFNIQVSLILCPLIHLTSVKTVYLVLS